MPNDEVNEEKAGAPYQAAKEGGCSRKPHRRLVRPGVVVRFGPNHRREKEIRAAVNGT